MNSSSPFSAALAVAVVAALLLATALVPGPLPAPRDPQIADVVFDSRVVVWIMRLLVASTAAVLVVGGVYIVASAVAHMRNGAWLNRAGPFEVAWMPIADLQDQVTKWQEANLEKQRQLDVARAQLERSVRILDSYRSTRDCE